MESLPQQRIRTESCKTTMSSQAPVPRYTTAGTPALLSQGFRPFFLATGLWGMVGLPLWLGNFWGWLSIPSAFDGYLWHIHEMLFGLVAAAIAGFILTAIPNWTGRLPLQGWPLLGLVSVWCAGRIAVGGSAILGAGVAAVVDISFLVLLTAVAGREIVAGQNWRNLPIVSAIGLLVIGNGLFHAHALGWLATAQPAWRLTIAVIVMLIALIGGRIIPSFTGNWLAKRDEARPPPFDRFDKITLLVTALTLAVWTVDLPAPPGPALLALLFALACLLNAWRLGRWRGHRTLGEPLLWILHVGYAWLPVGFGLLAAAAVIPSVARSAGVHALTSGAMVIMILAVSTRATLGHTGRELHAGPGTTLIYLFIVAAALARVVATLWTPAYMQGLAASGVLWLLAFATFLAVYGPKFALPDPRHRPLEPTGQPQG